MMSIGIHITAALWLSETRFQIVLNGVCGIGATITVFVSWFWLYADERCIFNLRRGILPVTEPQPKKQPLWEAGRLHDCAPWIADNTIARFAARCFETIADFGTDQFEKGTKRQQRHLGLKEGVPHACFAVICLYMHYSAAVLVTPILACLKVYVQFTMRGHALCMRAVLGHGSAEYVHVDEVHGALTFRRGCHPCAFSLEGVYAIAGMWYA